MTGISQTTSPFWSMMCRALWKRYRRKGVEIAKEPYSLQGSNSKIAFIKDPNGIWLELIEHR